ncbi:hypothetical protein E3J62_09605 [candidate division TA06 bacterium]|uniref:Uncharacterized protein n=1 Tax=candidate division TA06 bacterium TaxID=2250710 RepID=A0A523UQ68_UNCT6|nr:MAG: hypothetical protein E3J62_09605 [candidate division TA06 bacterium]
MISNKRPLPAVAISLHILLTTLFLPTVVYAGRSPEAWDHLPRLRHIDFSDNAVGFASTAPKRFFVLERGEYLWREVDAETYLSEFSVRGDSCEPPMRSTAWYSEEGHMYFAQGAYCAEGCNRHHKLWLVNCEQGVPLMVQDHVDSCMSISAICVISGDLWLGTRMDVEYGGYPGDGIIVQSSTTGRLVRRIDAEHSGLTGDLIEAVALDPETGRVWVTTEWGVNEVKPAGIVARSLFLYEDFNRETGIPEVFVSETRTTGNPFATLARTIGIDDTRAFYETVSRIPEEMIDEVTHLSSLIVGSHQYPLHAPVDSQWNILVPFVLKATQNEDRTQTYYAEHVLAMFDDTRARKYFLEILEDSSARPHRIGFATRYVGSRRRSETPTLDEEIRLLCRRVDQAISELHAMGANSAPIPVGHAILFPVTKRLQALGSAYGYKAIEDYFETADFSTGRDGSLLYDFVVRSYHREEAVPAILIALRRIPPDRGALFARTCSIFDMAYRSGHSGPPLYSADYVGALLRAYVRAAAFQRADAKAISACESAILSQLQNPEVRSRFLTDIHPHLKGEEARLSNVLLEKSQSR